jgi:hypothetical protein
MILRLGKILSKMPIYTQHSLRSQGKLMKYESFLSGLNILPIERDFIVYRGTLPKMEVATDEEYNPVKQDTRKNKKTGEKELRYYGKEPPFNYGMIP